MPKKILITKSELSKISGCSRAAVTKATKKGGALFPAMEGAKVNKNHPLVRQFLQKHGISRGKPKTRKKAAKKKSKQPPGKPKADIQDETDNFPSPDIPYDDLSKSEILDLENMTVKQVALQYGGMANFKIFIEALKGIADYKLKTVKEQQKRFELIDRKAAEAVTFALIDLAFKRLVAELPGALAQEIVTYVKSKRKSKNLILDVAEIIRGAISRILKDCKNEIQKRLKRLQL